MRFCSKFNFCLQFALFIFVWTSSLAAQTTETKATTTASPHSLTASVFASQKLNDDLSILAAIPKPILIYRYSEAQKMDFNLLSAVLLHRAEVRLPVTSEWKWTAGADTFLWKAGDEPNINGQSFDQYAFSAHRTGVFTGMMTRFGESPYRFDFNLKYEFHNLHPYDKGVAPDFVAPEDFWEHGIVASLESAARPPSELVTFGVRPTLMAGTFYRQGNRAWGVGGFQRDIDYYAAAMASVMSALPISPRFVFVIDTHLSWISDADRLNAIKGGVWRRDYIGMLTGDLRLDRAWASEMGLRYYLNDQRTLALRPFGHFIAYREIRMDRLSADAAGGAGLKLMGSAVQKFFWNLTYGFIMGDRSDKDMIHEVRGEASFKFF